MPVEPIPAIEPARKKFAAAIKCTCGQTGSAGWEKNAVPSDGGPKPVLLNVTSGFYLRLVKKDIGRTEIVCGLCNSVVRDQAATLR